MRVWTVPRAAAVVALVAATALVPAATASAVPGPVDGYVWVEQPSTVDYTVGHQWAYNSAGGDIRIEQGRIDGTAIRFVANIGNGRRAYEGTVQGNRITGTGAGPTWSATRTP